MDNTNPDKNGELPSDWLVHLIVEGDEEINYSHPAFARHRDKNVPKTGPAEKPPIKDGDPEQ
jgi:hypothetical protein